MLELFGEVGGGVHEYFPSKEVFSINNVVKSYREKTVLKTLQLEFRENILAWPLVKGDGNPDDNYVLYERS